MANEIKALNIGGVTYTIQPEYAEKLLTPITAADLGLESALKYHGVTTTPLFNGSPTKNIIINGGEEHTAENGCVVIYDGQEFFWNGNSWEKLGDNINFKVVQTAVADPAASSETSTTFIDTISQDVNGVITATKKTLTEYLPLAGGTMKANSIISHEDSGGLYIGDSYNNDYVNFIENIRGGSLSTITESETWGINTDGYASFKGGLSTNTGSFGSNVTINGTCSASNGFFETSDSRLKDFKDPIKVDLDKLSKLTKAYFTFKNDPEKMHLGVSAQEIQEIYPEIVNEDKEGFLTVDYAKLSVIALTAVDELNNRLNSIEERLSKLEK